MDTMAAILNNMITMLPAILVALAALVTAWRHLSTKIDDTQRRVETVHQAVNSRMDEMLRLTQKAAMAQGVLQEKGDAAQGLAQAIEMAKANIPPLSLNPGPPKPQEP